MRVPAISDDASRLLRFAIGSGHPFGHEFSAKFSAGACRADRHLLSFAREAFGPREAPLLDALERAFALPSGCRAEVRALWSQATHVHLGLEGADERADARAVRKLYLESAHAHEAARAGSASGWCAVHRAFKWRDGDSRGFAVTHYDALLARGLAPRQALLDEVLAQVPAMRAEMTGLTQRVHAAAPGDDAMLLRVGDRDTHRLSVDLNLYPLGWRVRDARYAITALAGACDVPAAAMRAWFEAFGAHALGHVAAGRDAHGIPFATVYFGAHGCGGGCRP